MQLAKKKREKKRFFFSSVETRMLSHTCAHLFFFFHSQPYPYKCWLLMGADTQQKNELPLCCYYKALPECRVASLCVAPQVGTLTGGFYWGAVLSQAACPMLTKPGIACCQPILCAPGGKNQLGQAHNRAL